MHKKGISFLQATATLTALCSFSFSQNTVPGVNFSEEQNQAFLENFETVHYSLASKIECVLQCVSAVTCCGISYRRASLECSINLSSNCSTVNEVGSVFMRNPSTATDRLACSGCMYFGLSSYKVISTSATWESSRVNCINLGGKLAEIETQEENDFLKSSLEKDSNYWIGGYDLRWITKPNETMVFTDWGAFFLTQEPDDPTNQRCLILWILYSLKWGTYFCSYEFSSVCEFV